MTMTRSFSDLSAEFVEEIEGLKFALKPAMSSASFASVIAQQSLNLFIEENGELESSTNDNQKSYTFKPDYFIKMNHLIRRVTSAAVAQRYLPESLFVTLISRFDAFVGSLIRLTLLSNQSLLESSEKPVSFRELFSFNDMNEAKELLIEREVEGVLRKSHRDHLVWFDNKLATDFTGTLPALPQFIELTERRNLFAHCDGVVSRQYLGSCKSAGFELESVKLGERLEVSKEYYRQSCDCILEVGVRIAHAVWRKLEKRDRERVDGSLFNSCFELLQHENYQVAHQLLVYANDLKGHCNEQQRLMFVVNLAQAKKWLNKDDECRELLQRVDWSATSKDFRICVAVLREDYQEAVALMRQLGPNNDEITGDDYLNWPVFQKARKEPEFQAAYREVFGKEMELGQTIAEITSRALDRYLLERRKKQSEKETVTDDDSDNDKDPR
jgi:hypothetical protein